MTIFGWDLSHFDAPGIGTAVAEGISFLTHKAGGDRDDPELGAWWAGVKDLTLPPSGRAGSSGPTKPLLGAYWVLYPGNPTGRADAFLARLDDQCPGWRNRPFILQLDCEKWNGDPSTVPGKTDIKAFCDRLVARMPKLRPIVYAPKWVYGDSLAGLGYPLWASSYVNGSGGFRALYPGDGSSKWRAYSGQTPAILQYSSSATIGGQSTCDANAYRGTLAELTALVAPGWGDEVTPEDIAALAKAVWAYPLHNPYSDVDQTAGVILSYAPSRTPTLEVGKKVDALATVVAGIAAGAVTEADIAALQAAIGQVDDQVLAALVGRSDADVAAALKAALGDRAAAVGALLAA